MSLEMRDAGGDISIWRVFHNSERGTHVVLRNTEETPGHSLVFTSHSFAECMAYANAGRQASRPGDRYWVFRHTDTGTLLVRWSERGSAQLSRVYGPGSFQECVMWARNHPGSAPQAVKRNVPAVKKKESRRPQRSGR
jgi:hypothetical protein